VPTAMPSTRDTLPSVVARDGRRARAAVGEDDKTIATATTGRDSVSTNSLRIGLGRSPGFIISGRRRAYAAARQASGRIIGTFRAAQVGKWSFFPRFDHSGTARRVF